MKASRMLRLWCEDGDLRRKSLYKLKTVPPKITAGKISKINTEWMIDNGVLEQNLANALPGHNCYKLLKLLINSE